MDIAKEALSEKDIWKFALNLGHILENPPSSFFEPAEGSDEPPCNRVEFYSRSLSSYLREMFSLSDTEVHSGLTLEKGVQPHCVVQSSLSGIMIEIALNPTDEKEGLKKIERNEYFSKYENFLEKNGFRAKLKDWEYTRKWCIGLNIYVNKEAKSVKTNPVVKKYESYENPKFGLVAVLTSNHS